MNVMNVVNSPGGKSVRVSSPELSWEFASVAKEPPTAQISDSKARKANEVSILEVGGSGAGRARAEQ